MANSYCKNCGEKFSNVKSLTSSNCVRHELGPHKGKHVLYEGSEKDKYTCKFCGNNFPSIKNMIHSFCSKHPNGAHKGRHAPSL